VKVGKVTTLERDCCPGGQPHCLEKLPVDADFVVMQNFRSSVSQLLASQTLLAIFGSQEQRVKSV